MHFKFISSIQELPAEQWDALWPCDYPFVRHAFLHALETSGSTTSESGWQPMHLVGYIDKDPFLVMPIYLKSHSYGEYVFDWAWADAYAQYGMNYYPKLLNAIPFTPCTGPRIGVDSNIESWSEPLSHAIYEQVERLGASSFHSLFPTPSSASPIRSFAGLNRSGCQFHWFNQNYQDFDDFLDTFTSRKRKNVRKERQKCHAFTIDFIPGNQIEKEDWQLFYQLYHRTYIKRSGRPGYLGASFFTQLATSMPDQILLAKVCLNGDMVAGAVYFRDAQTLYGRYWGCTDNYDGLHFETCYYQGIEYAIKHQLTRFDPGAQGEHKIQRGFQPVITTSQHWLHHPEFHRAVGDFCQHEEQHNNTYVNDARQRLPFKEEIPLISPTTLLEEKTWR